MIDMVDLNLNNKTMLLSNLSFDHPLSDLEINDLIVILSGPISIAQIYFKDNIDVDSIEKIKLLLEGLPNIDDSRIEKYIMKGINSIEKKQLDDMNFLNINTWNIAYSVDKNKYSITSLAKYRLVNEWFLTTIKEMDSSSSILEKICYFYDKVKMLEFDSQTKYGRIPEIIYDGKANSYGYNLVFKELLSLIGIPSKIEGYETVDGKNYITLAMINDDKYEISGIYLFDPSSDTISRDQYKNNLARRMNYNFFTIAVDKFKSLNGEIRPIGLFKPLISNDEVEYRYYLNNYIKMNTNQDVLKTENVFNMTLDEFYLKIFNTSEIGDDTKFRIFSDRVNSFVQSDMDREVVKRTLIENYIDRDSELFFKKSIKKMSKKDNINVEE